MAKRVAHAAQPETDRAQSRTLALIKQVQYRTYLRLEKALQGLGVTAVQYRILSTLKHRRNMSSAQLARLYDVKPQTMFKQISLLEAKGLIARAAVQGNKRVLEVELAPEGAQVLSQCDAQAQAVETELFRDFSPGELTMYRELMIRLLKGLQ